MELPDVPLFRGLTADEAEAAVTALRMRRKAFAKGEILLEAGQRAPALGVVLATRYTAQKTAADEAASSEENATISAFSASDLRTLTWIYQEQSATLNRDEDGNWTLEGSDAAVQTTRADSMVTALCSLTSNRVITEADPVQYGMTDPVVTVIYTLADGTEKTLYFGDTNPVTGDV
mgnify:CR=1 FL=1